MNREIVVFGIKTSRFIVFYGLALGIAALIALSLLQGYLANVAFLVIGALLGIYPAFIIEEWRRKEETRQLERALFYELANRVGRCGFDFEAPWHSYIRTPKSRSVFDLQKFAAVPPVIFTGVGAKIALLKDDAAQALIEFYAQLEAWRRDVRNAADEFTRRGVDVDERQIGRLAKRLRQALGPGKRALETLSKEVPEYEEIERNATRSADREFKDAHPNAGKLYRDRIALMLDATKDVDELHAG